MLRKYKEYYDILAEYPLVLKPLTLYEIFEFFMRNPMKQNSAWGCEWLVNAAGFCNAKTDRQTNRQRQKTFSAVNIANWWKNFITINRIILDNNN